MRKHAIRTVAIAGAMAFTLGAACAQDDEKECDDIMDELKKLAERLMNTSEPKGGGPVCALRRQRRQGEERRPDQRGARRIHQADARELQEIARRTELLNRKVYVSTSAARA